MSKLGTVIKFTFNNKVKTKSFKVTTLILVLIMSLVIHIPYFIELFTGENLSGSESSQAQMQIGLVYGENAEIAEELNASWSSISQDLPTLVKYDSNDAALQSALENEAIEGYLEFAAVDGQAFPAVQYVTNDEDGLDAGLEVALTSAIQTVKTKVITQGQLTEAQIAELGTPVAIQTKQLSPDAAASPEEEKDGPEFMMNFAVVYILLVLFFFTTMTTGNMIASEVTTEKSSRIMEILITSVAPLNQMFGKIIGMFLVGLTQIAIFVLVVMANLMLPHNEAILEGFSLDLTMVSTDVLVYGFLFYILGYFLYASLFAAVGSIVSRTEDLGQAVMPMTMLSLAAFYIATFSVGTPDSMLMKVSSYIPFFSPTSMIVRIGLGEVATWEILVSLLILISSIGLFGWLSAKIYRTGVLMYGKRPTIKELRKAMKAYKL